MLALYLLFPPTKYFQNRWSGSKVLTVNAKGGMTAGTPSPYIIILAKIGPKLPKNYKFEPKNAPIDPKFGHNM